MSNNSQETQDDNVSESLLRSGSTAARRLKSRPSLQGDGRKLESKRIAQRNEHTPKLTQLEIQTRNNQKRRLVEKARSNRNGAGVSLSPAQGGIKRNLVRDIFKSTKKKGASTIAIRLAPLVLLVVSLSSLGSLAGSLVAGGAPVLSEFWMKSMYLASEEDINNAELYYTEMETDLAMTMSNAAYYYPGYDEYNVISYGIGHNPYTLMAYLTVAYYDFNFESIKVILNNLFNMQYNVVTDTEIIYTDNPDDPDNPLECHVLNIWLERKPLEDIVSPLMNSEQSEHYDLLTTTNGGRQYVGGPLDFDWSPFMTSKFGWRVHPVTLEKSFHTGIDISIPIGTELHSVFDGEVITAAYDADGYGWYIILESENGTRTLYGHCDQLLISTGRVSRGDVVALSGNTGVSTGPHLYFEIINENGVYVNPLYFSRTTL